MQVQHLSDWLTNEMWLRKKKKQTDLSGYNPLFPDIPLGLGVEILLFSFLPVQDLQRCRLVNRQWNQFIWKYHPQVKQYIINKLIDRMEIRVKRLKREQQVQTQFSTYFWRNRELERMRYGIASVLLSCGIGILVAFLFYVGCSVLLKFSFGMKTLNAFGVGVVPAIVIWIVFYFSSRFILGAVIFMAKGVAIRREKLFVDSILNEYKTRG